MDMIFCPDATHLLAWVCFGRSSQKVLAIGTKNHFMISSQLGMEMTVRGPLRFVLTLMVLSAN
jgi:hypothetical protein